MTKKLEETTNIDELAEVALGMYNASVANYHAASISWWKMLVGETSPSTDACSKQATKVWGTMASDAANFAAVWQQMQKIAAARAATTTPTPPTPPTPPGPPTPPTPPIQ